MRENSMIYSIFVVDSLCCTTACSAINYRSPEAEKSDVCLAVNRFWTRLSTFSAYVFDGCVAVCYFLPLTGDWLVTTLISVTRSRNRSHKSTLFFWYLFPVCV